MTETTTTPASERHEFGAGGGDVGDEAAGARDDNRVVSGAFEDARQLDRAGIGGAEIERRRDDQHAQRMGRTVMDTPAGWRRCRQNRHQ